MEIALYPPECSEELAAALALAGFAPCAIDELEKVALETSGEWSVLVVELGDEPMRRLRLIGEMTGESGLPVIVVADESQLPLIEKAGHIGDFILAPPTQSELATRLRRLQTLVDSEEVLVFKDLELNPATYQASLDGSPLDLTYMEYELLRFFVERQGRVWTREQLLSKVWGYDYFGGARTVDVHVRRLRAKLGEERASWITTVRSVGYRFG